MKPYPLELRERIVESVDQNTHTIAELAEIYQITERYIYKLLKLRRETGDLTPLPHSGGCEPLLNDQHLLVIADLVARHPDATLKELKQMIEKHCGPDVCLTTVWNALNRCGLTVKKNAAGKRGRSERASSIY
jgi:transposase